MLKQILHPVDSISKLLVLVIFTCFTDSLLYSQVEGISNVAINERSISQIQWEMYPNPATESTKIHFSHKEKGRYELLNTLGKVVLTGDFDAEFFSLSFESLPKGIYYVRVILSLDARVQTKKLVIR